MHDLQTRVRNLEEFITTLVALNGLQASIEEIESVLNDAEGYINEQRRERACEGVL